jgi:hypothetical protein
MAEKRGILRVIISIQKMTPPKSDYFVYISTTPERARWGVEVLGSGFAKIASHQPYPEQGIPRITILTLKTDALSKLCKSCSLRREAGGFKRSHANASESPQNPV